MTSRPIIVAGGGLGGLAVALGMASKGKTVVVLEKAPEFGEIGAGMGVPSRPTRGSAISVSTSFDG